MSVATNIPGAVPALCVDGRAGVLPLAWSHVSRTYMYSWEGGSHMVTWTHTHNACRFEVDKNRGYIVCLFSSQNVQRTRPMACNQLIIPCKYTSTRYAYYRARYDLQFQSEHIIRLTYLQ